MTYLVSLGDHLRDSAPDRPRMRASPAAAPGQAVAQDEEQQRRQPVLSRRLA
jgi:hypothetical protein